KAEPPEGKALMRNRAHPPRLGVLQDTAGAGGHIPEDEVLLQGWARLLALGPAGHELPIRGERQRAPDPMSLRHLELDLRLPARNVPDGSELLLEKARRADGQ